MGKSRHLWRCLIVDHSWPGATKRSKVDLRYLEVCGSTPSALRCSPSVTSMKIAASFEDQRNHGQPLNVPGRVPFKLITMSSFDVILTVGERLFLSATKTSDRRGPSPRLQAPCIRPRNQTPFGYRNRHPQRYQQEPK